MARFRDFSFYKHRKEIACKEQYWKAVAPIFDMLEREKERGTRWSELRDKAGEVYLPLLQAFLDEVERVYKRDRGVAVRMFTYLVGTRDYYKIIGRDKKRRTEVYAFNLRETLNGEKVDTPTKILDMGVKKKSKTTAEIYMDNGWAFSFRLHSADGRIKPSLKFDVRFISKPDSVLSIQRKWEKG
ncbi:MAG: HaeIII family restriction endonuclease [Oscillospiraceae bacterium]|nr:HaeIII family restriction endonuclease [Oscillospiraceae bacterium]